MQEFVEGEALAGLGGEMHNGVDAVEGGTDGVEIAEVRLGGGDARHVAPVECREFGTGFEAFT